MSGDIALGGDAAAHSIPKSGVRPSVPHFFPGFLVLLPPTEIRDSPLAGRLPRDWRLLRRAALPQYHQSASSCCSRAATVRRRTESQQWPPGKLKSRHFTGVPRCHRRLTGRRRSQTRAGTVTVDETGSSSSSTPHAAERGVQEEGGGAACDDCALADVRLDDLGLVVGR
nr:uncharacterized protein LOC127344502 [Lolium perenne]